MELLTVEDLKKYFPVAGNGLLGEKNSARAVDGVSLFIGEQETVGLLGESGCGKSTLGRSILRLIEPSSGTIRYRGQDITRISPVELRPLRKKIQMIFQDPYGSLNPRMTIEAIVEEPLIVHRLYPNKTKRRKRTAELLDVVGVRAKDGSKYPGELSGGQRQRVMIARVLATEPELIIADEPVSALDVSIQSQILNLMRDLQDEFKISYLFISHDVGVVKFMSDRIAVMYLGVIVESGHTEQILSTPLHPYTNTLLASIPGTGRYGSSESNHIQGEIPSSVDLPTGCRFHPRCPHAMEICSRIQPTLQAYETGHSTACHLYGENQR